MKKLEKHHVTKRLLVLLCVAIATLFAAGQAFAAVSGGCVDCHTMHNSQDGSVVDSAGPNSALLNRGTCYGCHGDLTGAPANTPLVNKASNFLAGGTYGFLASVGDAAAHNVAVSGIDADATLLTPPGYNYNSVLLYNSDDPVFGGNAWTSGMQVSCAGTAGCHGSHDTTDPYVAVKGGHHNDTAIGYRMLNNIDGYESSDYDLSKNPADRNIYKGEDRTATTESIDNTTISYFCGKCHGDYHLVSGIQKGATMASPWVRHPTDIDMANARYADTEYAGYTTYSFEAPVASSISGLLTASYNAATMPDVTATGNAIVTCLSCHRAHGSDQPDLLRWVYSDMQAGAGGAATGTGCFTCHTEKD